MTGKKRFVVVTTEHRGVFGGYLNGQDETAKTITLTDAQMCVWWSASVGGVVGLAAGGPDKSCRVSPAAPKLVLQSVTAVMEATPEAEKAWRARPWSK